MTTFNTWANIPNIATLRSLGGITLCEQAADVVNVIGYYTASVTDTPDGGGGTFIYNASDTTSVDNGGTIIVDTVGRRWYRQFDGTKINVRWFGAKGDSDGNIGNGTDDTAAIQAAQYFANRSFLSSQFPVTGTLCTLYFPAGVYRVTDTLNTTGVDRGALNWQGDGKDSAFYHRSVLMFDHTNLICINVDPQFEGTNNGTVKDMVFDAPHQSTLQHCFYMVSGWTFIEGAFERLSFNNFTGCAVFFPPVDIAHAAYMQQVRFDDVSMSNIGAMIGYDPTITSSQSMGNVCLIRNCNLENSVNRTIATRVAFFDLLAFNEVQIEQIVYEGTGSTTSVIRFGGNSFLKVRGFHMEISPPIPTYFLELTSTPTNSGALVELESIVCENGLSGKVVKFNGRGNTIVRVIDYESAESNPQISDITDFAGAGTGNHVEIDVFPTNLVPYVSTNEVDKISFNNLRTGTGSGTFISDSSNVPYFSERGAWLDGVQDGIVNIAASGVGGVANLGMFTDSDEGRCFEIVGNNNGYPQIIITVTPPAAMVGQQMVFAVRFYLDSGQTPFAYSALIPDTTSSAFHDPTDLTQNAWVTEVAYCLVPSTTPFTVKSATQDLIAPTGVKKLRIAGIYISAGTEVPVTLIGGALATKQLEWSATAAPTYGDYIVGDKVTNSVPAVGQPLGWVCTVAGSPGTWVALANL